MKAHITCQSCDWSISGDLPDTEYNKEIRGKLARNIQEHHSKTGIPGGLFGENMFGHKDFEVTLENGETGEINGNSYVVYYSPPAMIARARQYR